MNDETFWLTVTNISLCVVTVACVVLFVRVMFRDILHQRSKRAPGLTTSDGDERLGNEQVSGQDGEAGRQTNE
jgi:hypothetical protein